MHPWIVRTIPPVVAVNALISSLSAPEYGRFSLPFREQVTPMWEEWRQTSMGQALNGKGDGCKSEPNLKTKPIITAATWSELKQKRLEELTPDKLLSALGNPLCILPDGSARYLPDFTDSTLDIRLTSKGLTYDLKRNQPAPVQPRLSVPSAAAPPSPEQNR